MQPYNHAPIKRKPVASTPSPLLVQTPNAAAQKEVPKQRAAFIDAVRDQSVFDYKGKGKAKAMTTAFDSLPREMIQEYSLLLWPLPPLELQD